MNDCGAAVMKIFNDCSVMLREHFAYETLDGAYDTYLR